MSFTFLCISILTWRGRWRWRTHPTPTPPHHPYHPHIPKNTSQCNLFWVHWNMEMEMEHTQKPLPPTTTQPLMHNYIRKGEFHIFMHFNMNMEREMENTPFTPPSPTTLTPLNTSHYNFFHHTTPNTQQHNKM